MTLYSRAETAESDDENAETDSETDGDDDQHWGPVWEDLLPVWGGSRGHNQGVYNVKKSLLGSTFRIDWLYSRIRLCKSRQVLHLLHCYMDQWRIQDFQHGVRWGGRCQPKMWGRQPIILVIFSRKLHEIGNKMDRDGGTGASLFNMKI